MKEVEVLDLQTELPRFENRSHVFKGAKLLSEEEVQSGVDRLKAQVAEIFRLGRNVVTSYIQIGRLLQQIDREGLYLYVHWKSQSYADIFIFASSIFGFSRNTTYSLLNVTKRFALDDGIKPEYEKYSYSKLVEMLPEPDARLCRFSPDMTVSEIRELRKIWEKYGCDETKTWKEELQCGRERMAAEEEEERQKKKKDNCGLLGMLTSSAGADTSLAFDFKQPETKVYKSSGSVKPQVVSFKNDAERKKFLSKENCETWDLYIEIPELKLKFYKFEFINGDSLIAEFGRYYSDYVVDKTKSHMRFRLHLQTKQRPDFDTEGIAETYVLEYLKRHAKELK